MASAGRFMRHVTQGRRTQGRDRDRRRPRVVEGSNGVHLKREADGEIRRAAYIPYPQLTYVYRRSRPSASELASEGVHQNR
jgi:hypothetical protein